MAVNKIVEAAARRLVQKLADLARGPATPSADADADQHVDASTPAVAADAAGAVNSTAGSSEAATAPRSHHAVDDVSAEAVSAEAVSAEAVSAEAVSAEAVSAEAQDGERAVSELDARDISPIRTRTLARLLAAQGHAKRALAIYAELIADNPGDLALVREAEALRAPSAVPRAPSIEPVRAPVALYGEDQITAAVVDSSTLFVHWEVTDAGAARARAVAENAGRAAGESAPGSEPALTLRVVILRAGADGVVRSEAIEHTPAPSGGETFVMGLPADATLFAALGVRRGERFVAITHAPAMYTPPNAPAELPALEFAAPPAPPASPVDARPVMAPVVVRLSPARAAVVLAQAEALRQPTAWEHSSDQDFHASSSREIR